MEDFSFERLVVYQTARKLVRSVYVLIEVFPKEERYGLADQLRRAIISVPSNIAESCGRRSLKEKIHFLEIAYGSLLEAFCQIEIAVDLEYLSLDDKTSIKPNFIAVSRLITALSSSYKEMMQKQ
ncbi:MAG: four helix bundle protein [Duncaniella sp.]|nr:four helix bundle protein [Duncaniella sp.]